MNVSNEFYIYSDQNKIVLLLENTTNHKKITRMCHAPQFCVTCSRTGLLIRFNCHIQWNLSSRSLCTTDISLLSTVSYLPTESSNISFHKKASIQGFWQSARVRSRTIDQKSHYFALFAFSRTLPHFSRLFAKKTHKLQN